MNRWHLSTLVAGIGILTAAAILAEVPSRDVSDSLYPVTTKLVIAGIVVIIGALVAATTRNWPNRRLFLVAAALIVIAALAYPVSHADQDKPVIFSPGLLFPLGVMFGGTSLVIAVFRSVRQGSRG